MFRAVWIILSAAILGLLNAPFCEVHSQSQYPTKPIQCVIGFPAGGPSDTDGRIMCKHAEKVLGQRIVIVNIAGAGGAAGWNNVRTAPRDGYWLTMYNIPHILAQPLTLKEANFTKEDFVQIIHFSIDPNVIIVRADSPYKSLEDIIADAKANPGAVTVAHSGKYIGHHLQILQMEDAMKIKLTDVSFSGATQSIACMLGGQCKVLSVNISDGLRLGDQARMLAIATPKRHPLAPDVPTFAEKGFPQVLMSSDRGIAAPKGVKQDIIKVLEDAFWKAAQTEEFKEDMKKVNSITYLMRGEEIAKYINDNEMRVRELLTRLGHIKKKN